MQPGDPEFEHVKNYLNLSIRPDPPFFKLTHKNQNNIERELCILGSIHNRHPDLLLPPKVLDEIKRLNPKAIYFTEHTPTASNQGTAILQQLFNGIDSGSSDKWDPVILFSLDVNQQDIWNRVKITSVSSITGMTLEWIQKIDAMYGVMIFQQFIPKISELKGKRIANFEKILQNKGWSSQENLEQMIDAFNMIGSVSVDLEKIFTNSLKSVEKIEAYEKELIAGNLQTAWQITALDYKNALKSYTYEDSITGNVKDSTKERNKEWEKKLMDYLDKNPSQDPLFIVVGNAHLSGGITQRSLSFLEYLSKMKGVSLIQRMDSAGIWINI